MTPTHATRPVQVEDTLTVRGPLMVVQLRSRSCDAILRRMLEALEAAIASRERPAMMFVMDSSAAAPGTEMRAAILAARKRHDGKVAAMAFVLEGTGFGTEVHRSVLSAVVFVGRGAAAKKLASTVEEAATWLVDYLPDLTARDIVGVVRNA